VPVTKADLVKAVYAKHGGLSYQEAKRIVDFIVETMKRSLEKGGHVLLSGFGTFEVVDRKARKGRNPRTGVEIRIPTHKALSFKPSRQLRQSVNRAAKASGGK
jgi:nucleoid DNA-binding protein